jgi:threonylcarbamoyladenosine tRNA methylthiotransferase MtaB
VCADAPRVAIRTLGCKVNRSDSEALAESLSAIGVTLVDVDEPADAIVVNTCTVTGEADAKARKEVRRALRGTRGPVVVMGCLAAIDADGLRTLGERVHVCVDRASLPDEVASLVGAGESSRPTTPEHSGPEARAGLRASRAFRTRALVKVQEGCDNRCAYCIIPDARGVPRSVPTADVVARVAAFHAAGVAEVVLTGVNLGRYSDESGASDLADLLDRIVATGVRRVRLSSIEPPDLGDRLLAAFAAAPTVAPHLHVPLQSGSDGTLTAMGRRYTTAEYAAVLDRARAAVPGLTVTTDVIVGFPGETDADFAESLDFIDGRGFSDVHVFRYSRRAGTPAAQAPGQVPETVKAARAQSLREVAARGRDAHARAREGGGAALLVESTSDGVARGTTEDHLHILAEVPFARPGDLVPVTLRLTVDGVLRGYYVGEGGAHA